MVVNLLVKGIFLAGNSLGGDEPFSVYVAQLEPGSIVKFLSTGNNPPLFELLLHYWIRVFGISECAVRFPSLIFSCVTVLFLYKIGRNYFNRRIAVYGCLFFVFSNYHIAFAHEARVYALMGMLTVMSMYYFLAIASMRGGKSRFAKAALLLTNLLLIYAHYFGFFVLVIQGLHILLSKQIRKSNSTYWLVSAGVLILAYSPNIPVLLERFRNSAGIGGTWLTPPGGVVDLYDMLWKFTNAPVVAALTIILLAVAFVKLLFRIKAGALRNFPGKLVASWFLLPFFGMFVVSFWMPVFLDRYLMFAAVGFYLLLAFAADSLIEAKGWKFLIPGIFCILFLATSKPGLSTKRNVREVVRTINHFQKGHQTAVLFCPRHFCLNIAYYYDRDIFRQTDPADFYGPVISELNARSLTGINHIREADLQGRNRVVFLDAAAGFSFPDNGILDLLQKDFHLKRKVVIDAFFVVYEFERI